jgi:hypothetical protein
MPSVPGKVEHRSDIHHRMCLSYGVVSDSLWQEAIDAHQPVGTCTRPTTPGASCGGLMRALPAEERGGRMFYPARCATCGREVEGQGPRPAKKGAER